MATEQPPSDTNKPKAWKCGDTFQYPIKKSTNPEDPWEVLFKNLKQEDEHQCEAWKDEVTNLLVFAVLFSAVVTAFVVEAYKGLSRDPNHTIISILSVIASRVGSDVTNSSDIIPLISDPFQIHFVPTATSVRVNIFFFVSLVLSLSAALIGIVCLQWLRAHQEYPDSLSSEQQFALLHMRTEALRRWKVHQIFTSLPVLVQAALVLFFIGLTDFVWNIDHIVIIPVGILIVVILLFLVSTTLLPTLQVFALKHPYLQMNNRVPVECPYRSPQAASCRRLVSSSKIGYAICSFVFIPAFCIILFVYRYYLQLVHTVGPSLSSFWTKIEKKKWYAVCTVSIIDVLLEPFANKSLSAYHELAFPQLDLLGTWAQYSWTKFDVAWMSIRDTYFRYGCEESSWLCEHKSDEAHHTKHYFDAIHGLRRVIEENFALDDESLIFAAFHSAQTLPKGASTSTNPKDRFNPIPILKTRNHYLSKILRYHKARSITHLCDIVEDPTPELLTDENACIFLNFICSKDGSTMGSISHTVSKTFAEMQLRLMSYMYERSSRLNFRLAPGAEKLEKPLVIQPQILFLMPAIDEPGQLLTHQWAITLHYFFKNICERKETDIEHTFVAHSIFQMYLSYFCRQLWYQPESKTVVQSISTVDLIKESLERLLEDKSYWEGKPSHCLFYCASYYFYWVQRENLDAPALLQSLDNLHPLLKKYKKCQTGPSKAIPNQTRSLVAGYGKSRSLHTTPCFQRSGGVF